MMNNDGPIPWAAYSPNDQAQTLYPTPPKSTDGGLECSAFPGLLGLGLAHPPAPMLHYQDHSPSRITGEIDSGEGTEEQVLTISTSFHPGSHPLESDLIFRSNDGIHFYAHTDCINKASQACLPAFLSFSVLGMKDGIIPIPETGRILNIILHTIYGSSVAHNSPTCDELVEAVDKMPNYGLVPKTLILPKTPLYTLLLDHAPMHPAVIYCLAAHHDIFALAQQVSSYMLAFPLKEVDDAMAKRMGPTYLNRLFLLHLNRMDAVKNAILQPPCPHPITKTCSFEDQKKLTRAWALGSTCLAWDVRADLSARRIKSVFEPLAAEFDCTDCQDTLKKRIRDVLFAWSTVKYTI